MDSDDVQEIIRTLRPGDGLKVRRLADLGKTMVDVLALMDTVHGRGAYVAETSTGRRSDKHAVEMIRDSLPHLRKGMTRRKAKIAGRKGGRPREDDRRMPLEKAKPIWRDTVDYKTNAAALEHMPGWSLAAANRYIGPSGRKKMGRPRKVLPKRRR